MELGLGAGYVKAEFDAAEIPFPSGGRRVEQLERTVTTLRSLFEDTEYQPRPAQPSGPPLLIGGWGDRLLRLAAAHADIIALTGGWAGATGEVLHLAGVAQTEERVAYVRGLLGDRADAVELNIMVQQVIPPAERGVVPGRFEPLLPPDAVDSPEGLPSV
ncbi:hypothetical protein [Streptomyces sp. NPDC058773]|uniref:hypothetical protein n=1 Tax=Streptomyces sp. NPDC058773 TaxID=3346632 RepID=UPI003676B945